MPLLGDGAGLIWEPVHSFVDHQINGQRSHVWPFVTSFPVDVRYLIVDRQHDIPLHRPDHLEVVVFESGELGYQVEDRTCALRQNDVVIVSNRIQHRCLSAGPAQREARTLVVSFLPHLFQPESPTGDDAHYLMPFLLQDRSFPNVIASNTGVANEISGFIERIGRELPAQSERSRLAIKTYLRMILLALANHYWDLGEARIAWEQRQSSAARLAPLFDHIQRHYEQPLLVTEAARLCAMSASCFLQLFKTVTGHSFVAYLNTFRVAKAKELLSTTNKTISEIALEAGFCNQSYFGVIFRRVTGSTPLAYRKAHLGLLSLDERAGSIYTAVNPPSTVKTPPTQ
ncbi:MAG TPA: AraC family transcriptional regulator [Bryobacteraceae bacterium]